MAQELKFDMFDQVINVDDYVCCSSSSATTGMYIGKVEKITAQKVRMKALNGAFHQKSFDKVFVVTAQIETIPELMV